MSIPINHRILLVDDNPAIHDDIRKVLTGRPSQPGLEAAESILFGTPLNPTSLKVEFATESAFQGKEALEKVRDAMARNEPFAMAFIDVRMPPGWDGIETVEALWKLSPGLQVVLCTAFSDYSWEKMTARLGINENLFLLKKPFDNIEVLQLAHALTRKWQITQQANLQFETLERMVDERTQDLRLLNAQLSRSEERFAKAFRISPIPQAIQTLDTERFVDVNEAFLKMTGFQREELIGQSPQELHLSIEYKAASETGRSQKGEEESQRQAEVSTKSGESRQALVSLEQITLGDQPHVLVIFQDITERLRMETQLRQAQKMEAIGQLAAGVAHDFNNFLTIIECHASLQLALPGLSAELTESFEQIEQAAERAAALTRQLLTFSRRQVLQPRVLDLNLTVGNLTMMLRRLLGGKTILKTEMAENLPPIYADQTNLEQIVMNLTLNARDAMPEGGEITILSEAVCLSPEDCKTWAEARPGEFIRLSIRDTGIGMDEATSRKIFEPFFTTKAVDKGTGMGLATVYGIVQQHQGWIEVVTALGKGTTFRVYLPITEPEPKPISEPAPSVSVKTTKKTILIVEDEDAVRHLVRDILVSEEFDVVEASNAESALEQWRTHRNEIALLITDMVMPGAVTGLELAEVLQSERADLKVIFTSGYSSDLFKNGTKLQEGVNYLPKPYLSPQLVAIVQQCIEGE